MSNPNPNTITIDGTDYLLPPVVYDVLMATADERDAARAQALADRGFQTENVTLRARVVELEEQKSEAQTVLMAGDNDEETRLAALRVLNRP